HKHRDAWKGVKRWVLITNVLVNDSDRRRWEQEVVPAFREEGLDAELCSGEQLESRALNYPSIIREFIEGDSRVFASLGEAAARLAEEDGLGDEHALIPLQGRQRELTTIEAFIKSDDKWLLLQGPGGIGKTRLMYEAGALAAQHSLVQDVFWAIVPQLEVSTSWHQHVNPDREVLLLLDEPDDPGLVRRLRAELQGRARKWKVILTVRRPKDPVIDALKSTRPTDLSIFAWVCEHVTEFHVCQARQAAPYHDVAWWRIACSVEVATESRKRPFPNSRCARGPARSEPRRRRALNAAQWLRPQRRTSAPLENCTFGHRVIDTGTNL
ncbi:MAG: hypothetical protein R3C68_12010, partial [Myxococcota bacterium]